MRRFLHLGNVFGGGVFIGAGFIHLLPDAVSVLEADPLFKDYPSAFAFTSAGLLLTLLVEMAAVHSVVSDYTSLMTPPDGDPHRTRLISENGTMREYTRDSVNPSALVGRRDSTMSAISVTSLVTAHGGEQIHRPESIEVLSVNDAISPQTTKFAAFATFIALSFHSLMAGIALGVAPKTFSSIFLAIIAHKTIAGFALGTSFVRAHQASATSMTRRAIMIWLAVFSAVTPVGIFVGLLLTTDNTDKRIPAILTAVAAGTFLHVGLVEIVAKEFESGATDKLPKAVALLCGWGFMATIALWL
jgi:zinc transporter 1/2/3